MSMVLKAHIEKGGPEGPHSRACATVARAVVKRLKARQMSGFAVSSRFGAAQVAKASLVMNSQQQGVSFTLPSGC